MKTWLSLLLSVLTVPIMLSGCTSAPADDRPLLDGKALVTFGDSLTAHSLWPMTVAQTLNMELINSGIGANTTAHGMERFERDVAAHDPDFVIICFGSNDFYRKNGVTPQVSLEDYRANLQHFVDQVKALQAEPILMTPPFISESASGGPSLYPEKSVNKALDVYVEAMREIAEENSVVLIDIHKVFDDSYTIEDVLCSDGVHPSDHGHEVYADTICKVMREHFRQDKNAPRVEQPQAPAAEKGAWTKSLVPFEPEDWDIIYPGTAEGDVTEDGAIAFWNTNNLWPEVHYSPALEDTIAAPYMKTSLTIDLDLKAATNILLFFNGPTPTHTYETTYVSLTHYIKAADPTVKVSEYDLEAGQTIRVTIPLKDFVPTSYIRDDGTVLFSGVKVFVSGVAYSPITIRELSITTIE